MVLLLQYAVVILGGYLLGSIPTGYIIGRMKGIDVTEYGSGRIGGTNVLRSVGRLPFVLTAVGDVVKGAAAVLLGRVLLGTELAASLAGIAAVVGHNWSIYIGFRGGAGTATYMGGFVVLSLIPTAIVGLSSFIVGFGLRYASVTSILISCLMAPALLIAVLFFNEPVEHLAYALAVGAIILFSHRPNFRRLLSGTERRIGEPARKIGEEET
jgi:glycerol-3-phosphate acyltransferase PlsY